MPNNYGDSDCDGRGQKVVTNTDPNAKHQFATERYADEPKPAQPVKTTPFTAFSQIYYDRSDDNRPINGKQASLYVHQRPMSYRPYVPAPQLRQEYVDTKTMWNIEHNINGNLLLQRRQSYVNPGVNIKYLTQLEMTVFKISLIKRDNGQCYFLNYSGSKVNIEKGLFVVAMDGTMYVTYDREDPKRTVYSNRQVLCHCSFATQIAYFAGLITMVNGVPTMLSNESGTFLPGLCHTARVRKIIALMCNISPHDIVLELILRQDTLSREITDMLQQGYNDVVQVLLDNTTSTEQNEIICNAIISFTNSQCKLQNVVARVEQPPQPQHIAEPLIANNTTEKDTSIERACVVCLEQQPNVLFLPCKHIKVCSGCHKQRKNDQCPVCRCEIKSCIDNVYI